MKNYIETILNFLTKIKIAYEMTDLKNKTLLPGLFIQNGILQIDINKLKYPGDILHEAGHIAVCEPIFREQLTGDVYKNGLSIKREPQAMHGEEIAATAWSVAAVKYLGLPMELIFHEKSYKGSAQNLFDLFENGGLFGQPLLQAWDMTCPNSGFPIMREWIRKTRWINSLS
ncbi:hypothetical protein [Pseudoalteromonas sp. L1]|uniref:hypothetical protein n=1 Tax=unclassified Pseudoalteromonas TaxID=194690 RepID=UPI001F3ACC00|nr:hypothetical protein [Pseudoalteromonas sp. L1]